jgi:hypothetical protein
MIDSPVRIGVDALQDGANPVGKVRMQVVVAAACLNARRYAGASDFIARDRTMRAAPVSKGHYPMVAAVTGIHLAGRLPAFESFVDASHLLVFC